MAPRQWALSPTQVDDLLSESSRYVPSARVWWGKIKRALPIALCREASRPDPDIFFHPFYFTAGLAAVRLPRLIVHHLPVNFIAAPWCLCGVFMGDAGLFINLDRCPERRAAMEAQLRRYGLADRYQRFPAIDDADGQRGCFQSHIGALESAAAGHASHVLEDDALLSGYVPQVVEFVVSTGVLDRFDIVFTETLIGPDILELRELKKLFDRHRADETFEVRDITSTY